MMVKSTWGLMENLTRSIGAQLAVWMPFKQKVIDDGKRYLGFD
jgi:hypothetical protein